MPSDKIIQTQCPACGRQFKVAYGKVQEDPLSTGAGNAVNGIMHRYRSWAFSKGNPFYLKPWALVVMLGILFYGGRYIKDNVYEEHVRYSAFESDPSVETANHYLAGFFRDGKADAVRHVRDSFQIETAALSINSSCDTGACNCESLSRITWRDLDDGLKTRYTTLREDCMFRTAAEEPTMGNVDKFLSGYSNSLVYGDSILAIKRSVLARAVSDFDANLPVGAKLSRNQRFFRNALVYISETGQNTIYVKYNQRKALKDWTDYDAKTLESVDEIMELSNMLEGTKYPKPSVSPPESINRFFKDNTSDLESFLVKSIRTKVDSLFGLGTLRVQRHSNADPATGIFMNVDYFVSTLEDDFTGYGSMPSLYIWTQTEEPSYGSIKVEGGNARFKGYMLATGIEWKLEMKYPGVERPYVYTQSSRPQAEIRDVNTQTQAQLRMMATAFHNFSESFLAEFGVE